MKLHTLAKRKSTIVNKKRVGRGYGSGAGGHTAGRGMKGQKSRSGHKSMVLFEGGNLPFYKRMPKYRGRGKNNPVSVKYQPINLSTLEEVFESGEKVSLETLQEKGLIRKNTAAVKILGMGEIKKKLTIEGLVLSESAKEKILAAKGKIV